MVFENIEKLKREWTDKYVIADTTRPELARFRGQTGTVKTINMNGRALVQFDANSNIGWYDIALDYLKIVDAPLPKPAEQKERGVAKAASTAVPAAEKPTAAPKRASTADILAAARGKPAAGGQPQPAKKPSTADILAAARGKPATSSAQASAAPKPADKPSAAAAPRKLSTAEILAAARAKQAAPAAESTPAPPPEPVEAAATAAPSSIATTASSVEKPAAKAAALDGPRPATTAEKIAYCRRVDAKG